jgi:hypothetical protein
MMKHNKKTRALRCCSNALYLASSSAQQKCVFYVVMAVTIEPKWSADMGHAAVYLKVIVTEYVVKKRTLAVPSYHPNTFYQMFLGV